MIKHDSNQNLILLYIPLLSLYGKDYLSLEFPSDSRICDLTAFTDHGPNWKSVDTGADLAPTAPCTKLVI